MVGSGQNPTLFFYTKTSTPFATVTSILKHNSTSVQTIPISTTRKDISNLKWLLQFPDWQEDIETMYHKLCIEAVAGLDEDTIIIKKGYEIKVHSLNTLQPKQCLNDEIVNAYGVLLNSRPNNECFIFSSFLLKRIGNASKERLEQLTLELKQKRPLVEFN